MSSAELAGREGLLGELRELAGRATSGVGFAVLMTGAVCCGKTALITQFVDCQALGGALLLETSGTVAEGMLPFGLARRLFEQAPLSPERRREVTRQLDEAAACADPAARLQAVPRLSSALINLDDDRPLVLAVDNVHLTDDASRQFLLHVAGSIRHKRVLMVLTGATTSTQSDRHFRSQLAQLPNFRRMRLPMLTVGTVRDLLRRTGAAPDVSRFAEEIHRITGGNPLLVRALAAEPQQQPGQFVRSEVYDEALLECLHRCGADALQVAAAVAVLGDGASAAQIGRALEIEPDRVAEPLLKLTASGIMTDGRLRDPLAARIITAAFPAPVLSKLHRRAANMLYHEGADSADVARHLMQTSQQEPWTAPVLQKTAERALLDGDVDFARRCLTSAVLSCPDGGERAAIQLRLTEVVWRSTLTGIDAQLSRLTQHVTAGHLDPSDTVTALSYLAWSGRVDQAADVAERLPAESAGWSGGDAGTVRSAVWRWLSVLAPGKRQLFTGDPDGGPVCDGQGSGPALPGPAGVPDHAACHAAQAMEAALKSASHEEAVFVLQQYQLSDANALPLTFALWALVYADRVDLAAVWGERLLGECRQFKAPAWQAMVLAVLAEVDLRRDNLRGAERQARTALKLMNSGHWGVGVAYPLSTLVQALTETGQYDEAMATLRQPLPKPLLETLPGLHYRRARGRACLALGRHQAALTDLRACGELMQQWDLDSPGLLPWRSDAAEALLALDDPEQARALAGEQRRRVRPAQRRLLGSTLRVLGLSTPSARGDAGEVLQEAVDILEGTNNRLQLALALRDLGDHYQSVGDFGRARTLMRRTWHIAKSCGAEPVCDGLVNQPADQEPAAAEPDGSVSGLPQRPDSLLSGAEHRVAVLAAHGLTNREISARLYITVSTVEQHLTRIYRKLQVKRRRDLAVKLSDTGKAAICT